MDRNKKKLAAQIGARITQIRGDKTLNIFAAELGIAHPTLYRYETDRIPDLPMLLKIASQDPERRGFMWLTTGEGSIYKDARAGAGTVEEDSAPYLDSKRIRLVREVKELIKTADDETIDALLKNVRQFKRIPPVKKEE